MKTVESDFFISQRDLFNDEWYCRHCGVYVYTDHGEHPWNKHSNCSVKGEYNTAHFDEDNYDGHH